MPQMAPPWMEAMMVLHVLPLLTVGGDGMTALVMTLTLVKTSACCSHKVARAAHSQKVFSSKGPTIVDKGTA